jgi:DUF4097 and DUF4098 domain-containing protein YvlB
MRLSVPLALILLSLPLAADFWGNSDRFKEDFSYDFKLAPGGRLEVESFNGSVDVIGWDNGTVQVRGNKHASRQEVLKALAIDAKGSPTEVRLRAISPSPNCNCGVTFTIKVPRKTRLDNVATSNAGLRIENIEGRAHARTSNGGIRLYDIGGDLEATTSNGGIEAQKVTGQTILHTSNGRIRGDNLHGGLEAATTNSSIDVTVSDADPARPLILSSSNGGVTLNLLTWKGNEIRATTSNGSVNLLLPAALNARVKASTSNGSVTSDFEMTSSHVSKTSLDGRIGQGGAPISAQTSNGNVRIAKR